jgi:hypothetical protein
MFLGFKYSSIYLNNKPIKQNFIPPELKMNEDKSKSKSKKRIPQSLKTSFGNDRLANSPNSP